MLRGNGVSRAALITSLTVALTAGVAAMPVAANAAARHPSGPARVTSPLRPARTAATQAPAARAGETQAAAMRASAMRAGAMRAGTARAGTARAGTARAGTAGSAASAPRAAGATEAKAAICKSAAHPALAARISRGIKAAMSKRSSIVGVSADDRITGVTCAFQPDRHFYSASVVKATILAALLHKLAVKHQFLTKAQAALATKMITVSDNNAASALWAQVGRGNLRHFLNLARMKQTVLGPGGAWGLTQLTAHDELLLLKLLTSKNSVLDQASRNYELSLMARVIPSERWGVPAGAPADVTVHVKNGWLPYPVSSDWHINSIGSFSGHHHDYMIVVLTTRNPTMAYGVDTVQLIAEAINRGLNAGVKDVIPAAAPSPGWGTPDEPVPAPGRT